MAWGGRRLGAGRKMGGKWAVTLEKELAREELRKYIREHIEAMVSAQAAAAMGIKYLVTRAKNGKFTVVTEAMARNLSKQGSTDIIEVWEKGPSFQAFKEFMDRFYDKPMEPAENVVRDLEVTYKWDDGMDGDPEDDAPAEKNVTPKKALGPAKPRAK